MAARKTTGPKWDPVHVRSTLEIMESVGITPGQVAYDTVAELLPISERPRITSPGQVSVEIGEPPIDIVYSAADHKKLQSAVKDNWLPLEIDLGKKGVVTIEVKPSYFNGEILDWL